MIAWSLFPFVRLTPALLLGIAAYLQWGERAPDLLPVLLGMALLYALAAWYSGRLASAAATDATGIVGVLAVVLAGFVLTQQRTESRRADHIGHVTNRIEAYEATVDEYPVTRPNTFATTLRVRKVRLAGRWQTATGGIRISLPRAAGVPVPQYGQVWLVRGHPDWSKGPLNPGEFDYRRYLEYRQVYHQQFVHPDQYRVLGTEPSSLLRAISFRAARVLDGVFRQYITAPREYALASALVLGIKDDIDDETKRAYASTGTTHIMAVSGLQVGLLFGALDWLLKRFFGALRGFRWWSAALGLTVIWSYAFVTGLSASVLRATVMFSLIIVARALGRQSSIINTLAVAAFGLLVYDPYLVADVGFQLSFLAVLSIVYLQPLIAKWVDAKAWAENRRRPWQPRPVQWLWQKAAQGSHLVWQATALSLAAQVATFPLGLYYFHQFPLSFLFSNLVAVPISSGAVYIGLGLLALKGVVAVICLGFVKLGLLEVNSWLDVLPQGVGKAFEWTIWAFNEYIFFIGRLMPRALVSGIHVTGLQTVLIFFFIGALLVFLNTRRLPWLGAAAAVLLAYGGSRAAYAWQVAPDERLLVYSIPRRSVVGFWQGSAAEFVTVDSLPLSETERTYRLVPGLIRRGAQQSVIRVGWRGARVPGHCLAAPDSLRPSRYAPSAAVVLATWRGQRLAFVSGRLGRFVAPCPVEVLVLRRNARARPEQLAAAFGTKAQVVFDSSCKTWYVARLDSGLRAQGFRTWDVTAQGAFQLAVHAGAN